MFEVYEFMKDLFESFEWFEELVVCDVEFGDGVEDFVEVGFVWEWICFVWVCVVVYDEVIVFSDWLC